MKNNYTKFVSRIVCVLVAVLVTGLIGIYVAVTLLQGDNDGIKEEPVVEAGTDGFDIGKLETFDGLTITGLELMKLPKILQDSGVIATMYARNSTDESFAIYEINKPVNTEQLEQIKFTDRYVGNIETVDDAKVIVFILEQKTEEEE